MNYSTDGIPAFRSYVENQGDKFHPLSDELSIVLAAGDSPKVLLRKLLVILDGYEVAPVSRYHLYHVGELRARLAPPEG